MQPTGDNRGGPRQDLREAAVEVVRRLSEAGYTAYFAGGCVRDRLMGLEPTDYDVASDARPEQVGALFGGAHRVGESFGVMLVSVMGHQIEVATFRSDGFYSDGRRPDTVTFSDAGHDAKRRDFTINGLFEDPLSGRVIDFVAGQADLEARLIKAIGDPEARLAEDRLRMLRAVRFAARFSFAIDAATAEAIRGGAKDLGRISRERIGQEVRRMLTDRNRAVAAREIQNLGLDAAVLGESHQTAAPTRLGRLMERVAYPTALAAWMLDRAEQTFSDVTARVRGWSTALVLSNAERTALGRCLEVYETLRGPWLQLGVARQKRVAAGGGFDDAMALLAASDSAAFVEVRRRATELAATGLAPSPLIDGDDLIGLGMTPGPGFKCVLDAVYDAQLEGTLRDKPAALELARSLARRMESD